MNFLAFDTTTAYLTVCAKVDGVLREHTDVSPLRHSLTLMPMIDKLLGADKDRIDAVGVCIGPGSFTGIRIGVTTAKTLAWAWNVPIVVFSAVELLGFREKHAVAVVDGGNRVYYVCEIRDGRPVEDVKEIAADDLVATLDRYETTAVIVGAGRDGFTCKVGDVSARAVAELVEIKWKRGETTDCFEAEPLYVQLSQAEKDHK